MKPGIKGILGGEIKSEKVKFRLGLVRVLSKPSSKSLNQVYKKLLTFKSTGYAWAKSATLSMWAGTSQQF